MSQENVDVVAELYARTNARDWQGALATYADDVELVLHGELRVMGGEGAVGKRAVGEWFADWFKMFDSDYRFEVEEMRDWGDRVYMVAIHHGRGLASQVPLSTRTAWIYTVREGAIARCDAHPDASSALAGADGADG